VSAVSKRIYSSADQANPAQKQGQLGVVCGVSEHGQVHGAEMRTGPDKAKWSLIKAAEPGRGKRPGCVGLGKVYHLIIGEAGHEYHKTTTCQFR
jgi:hypothetical protein